MNGLERRYTNHYHCTRATVPLHCSSMGRGCSLTSLVFV